MSSYQQVDVYVYNNGDKTPMAGVLARVYDEAGNVLYADALTDASGHAGFLLWTGVYTLRFFKFQCRFQQPQVINVIEGSGGVAATNAFNVYAESIAGNVSTDPYLCRASGYFRDITGAPHRYVDIIFIGDFAPVILDGSAVLSERRMIRTDKTGYACVDLIRCAQYSATIEGLEDQVRTISVPSAPSVNLPDLLFPTAKSVSFDPRSPWTLSAGSTLVVTPTVLTSSGVVLDGSSICNVKYAMEDPSVASVEPLSSSTLQIRGIKSGSTRLLVTKRDTTVITVPFREDLIGSGQSVVVQ